MAIVRAERRAQTKEKKKMGNLFNSIETKVCKKCGHEKPLLEFQKKQVKNGVIRRESYCKDCFGAIRWERMSDAAKEAKRARDRAALTKDNTKARIKRANDSRLKRKKIAAVMANVGAFCIVQWHECVKCGKKQYLKNREIGSDKCLRCSRTVYAAGPIPIRPAICPKCGISHTAKIKNAMCAPCATAANAASIRRARKAKGGRDRSILDRVKRYGVRMETVNKKKVYERDKYKCYVCGIKVVISEAYKPNQATLDHVIPLSVGGSHTYDNVRTCCHVCNTKKLTTVRQGTQIGLFCAVAEGDSRKEAGRLHYISPSP